MSSAYLSKKIHQQIAELSKLVDLNNLDGVLSLSETEVWKLIEKVNKMEKKLLSSIMYGLHYPKTRSIIETCRTNFQICSQDD